MSWNRDSQHCPAKSVIQSINTKDHLQLSNTHTHVCVIIINSEYKDHLNRHTLSWNIHAVGLISFHLSSHIPWDKSKRGCVTSANLIVFDKCTVGAGGPGLGACQMENTQSLMCARNMLEPRQTDAAVASWISGRFTSAAEMWQTFMSCIILLYKHTSMFEEKRGNITFSFRCLINRSVWVQPP